MLPTLTKVMFLMLITIIGNSCTLVRISTTLLLVRTVTSALSHREFVKHFVLKTRDLSQSLFGERFSAKLDSGLPAGAFKSSSHSFSVILCIFLGDWAVLFRRRKLKWHWIDFSFKAMFLPFLIDSFRFSLIWGTLYF